MAPNSITTPTIATPEISHEIKESPPETTYKTLWGYFKTPLIWHNIILITAVHVVTVIAYTTAPSYFEHKRTIAWCYATAWAAGFGVTAGAHRLWTHKSYKAKLPLRIILIILYSMAGHNRLRQWVRDHRVHHKFSETDADPHNANRRFFFAHVGWLMMKKHPEVLRKGKTVDCSDLLDDPVVVFFEKYFWPMKLFFCFVFPIMIPYLLFNETFYWSVMSCIARYVTVLNLTWLVNSAAHMFGNKPYDRRIQAADNVMVSILAMGEGWHNYHHTFPWDYKAAELGNYTANPTTLALDFFAKIGWAYDLKTPSKRYIQQVMRNRGNGSGKP